MKQPHRGLTSVPLGTNILRKDNMFDQDTLHDLYTGKVEEAKTERKFTPVPLFEQQALKELETQVTTFLTSLNRHERRAFCARLCRNAGKARDKALRAVKPIEKAQRQADRKNDS